MSKNTDIEKLESVLIYLVYKSNEIGVYHLNKLTYLFEYFYIKNFGERFTKEYFLKYPHGPVISNYKRIFINLAQREFFLTNTDELKKNRKPKTKSTLVIILVFCLTPVQYISLPIIL